jgi:phospholipase D1/2
MSVHFDRDSVFEGGFEEGVGVWRRSHAERACLLVDGSSYYRDLFQSLLNAKRRIFIEGWDLYSETVLVPESEAAGVPNRLAELLKHLANANPHLEIRLLLWDSFPFFMTLRESRSRILARFDHPQIRLVFNRRLPLFASFHQKLVVIDGYVAYTGGIDLTANRNDDPEHNPPPEDNGTHGEFVPIHDVQLRVEGHAAQALDDLALEDWERVTGERLSRFTINDPCHHHAAPDVLYADVVISRTRARWRSWKELKQIEELLPALIARAEKSIYIECQYLSSQLVSDALKASLESEVGPEIILVSSRSYRGWWEKRTLGALRNKRIRALERADRFGRFGAFHPALPHGKGSVSIHSKLMIIDECYVCVSSANLTARSMGLDSEIALTLDFKDNPTTRKVARQWRDKLLAEHLGLPLKDLVLRLERSPSLLAVIRTRAEEANGHRSLLRLPEVPEDAVSWWLTGLKWGDPGCGLSGQRLLYQLLWPNLYTPAPLPRLEAISRRSADG